MSEKIEADGLTEYDVPVNLPQLQPGTYLIKLKSGSESAIRTFIVY